MIVLFVRTNEHRAAAAARIGARTALRERSALMGALRSCFARTQTWLQAGKYVNALASELPADSHPMVVHVDKKGRLVPKEPGASKELALKNAVIYVQKILR